MNSFEENLYKKLVKAAYEQKQLSKESEKKFFTHLLKRINEHSAGKLNFKQRLALIFGTNPVLVYSFITFFILTLGSGGLLAINSFAGKTDLASSLIVISPLANLSLANEQAGQSEVSCGYTLKAGNTIRTLQDQSARLQLNDQWLVSLLPESELTFMRYNQYTNTLHVKLTKGALYLKTTHLCDNLLPIIVHINDYNFSCMPTTFRGEQDVISSLTESRTYLGLPKAEQIDAVCYAGSIKVEKSDTSSPEQVTGSAIKESAPISIKINSGTLQKDSEPHNWDEQIKELDHYLAQEQILSKQGLAILNSLNKSKKISSEIDLMNYLAPTDVIKITQARLLTKELEYIMAKANQTIITKTTTSDNSPEVENRDTPVSPYRIRLVGKIANVKAENHEQAGDINFFSGLAGKDSACLVSRKTCYLLKNSHFVTIKGLPANEIFASRPIMADNYILLSSLDTLYQIDPVTEQVTRSIRLPNNGITSDNYYPCYLGNTLFMPFQNLGYCTLQLDTETPEWKKLYSEPFPFAPLIIDTTLVIGSYYSNYLTRITNDNNEKWKNQIQGRGFSNPVLKVEQDGSTKLLMYSENNRHYAIAQFNLENGMKEKEWPLPNPMYADFIYKTPFIFGVDITGNFFSMNTENAQIENVAKVIQNKLTISEWRNVYPLLNKQFLYIGTDTGKLIIYNLQAEFLEASITVDQQSSFYTQPISLQNTIYLISDAGIVYGITPAN